MLFSNGGERCRSASVAFDAVLGVLDDRFESSADWSPSLVSRVAGREGQLTRLVFAHEIGSVVASAYAVWS